MNILSVPKKHQDQYSRALAAASDEHLRLYIPNVYQKDIYHVDYQRLWVHGIRLISFDIDDTIQDSGIDKVQGYLGSGVKMPKRAVTLFHRLKKKGFALALLSNTSDIIASDTCNQLGADWYIADAEKPHNQSFERLLEHFDVDRSQAAHVGNNIIDDIYGGNNAGITTCMVRRAGITMKAPKVVLHSLGMQTTGEQIRRELLARGMWRKHHLAVKGDQYYQLGEKQYGV